MGKQAVLLLAHGTPETVEQVPEYLRNVVSGRPVPPHVVEEIQHRYALIGRSPLTEITLKQARLVEEELNDTSFAPHPGDKNKDAARLHPADEGLSAGTPRVGHPDSGAVRVYVGMRNWKPYIADVVKGMRADQVEQAAVICMAPQNSRTSVGLYRRAVEAEAQGLRIDFTEGWARHPLLIEAFAERLRPAWTKLSAEMGHPVPVLFTAHSVPRRTVEPQEAAPHPSDKNKDVARVGHPGRESAPQPHWPGQGADPYAEEARHTAELVAARMPEIPFWRFAFQSQGASGGEWIGPSVEETLEALAREGVKTLLLQPIGFLCDHVEILFDVDRLFREYAAKLGIRLERPESLNDSRTLARAVADLAQKGLARLSA
jgi:protoporphyrin/coproporphyrin ferrochelatase